MNATRRMINIIFRLIAAVLVAAIPAIGNSYEIDTHAQMTFEAYRRSTLTSRQQIEALGLWKSRTPLVLNYLGFAPLPTARLPLSYFDQINQPLSRNIQEFDYLNKIYREIPPRWSMISESGVRAPYFVGDWLARRLVVHLFAVGRLPRHQQFFL